MTDTLFQAREYAGGPKPLPLISTLIDKQGTWCVSNKEKE